MTKKEAKELTLEAWRYLAEHPECYQKYMLPENIYIKIREFPGECPLCGLFALGNKNCTPCPLYKAGEGCGSENSAWERWRINYDLDTDSSRKAAAGRIVEIVEAWEPEASE